MFCFVLNSQMSPIKFTISWTVFRQLTSLTLVECTIAMLRCGFIFVIWNYFRGGNAVKKFTHMCVQD